MTESTTSEFSTQCTQLIKYIEDVEREDKSAAEQQYQDLLVCIECDHTKKRSEVMAEPWKRVQHKIIKAKLMDGNYFEACVRKIKVNESLMISPSSRSHRRRAEWCRCVLECSKQLTAVNGNLKVASGSPFPATNPAPPLHLALMLRLELDIFSNLLSTKMDSWGELDLLNRNILHVAAECKNSAAIQCLLNQLGPIPDAVASLLQQRDVVARTPLLVAAHLGNVACFQLLVGAGANLTDLDTESLGALELACRAGNKDVVEYLLRYRGDFPVNGRIGPHAPNPLHNAAKGNFGDICELLLAAGADVDMRDLSTGKTAATLAYERGHHDLAFYLSTRPQPVASRGQLPHGDMFNQLDMDTTDYNNQSF
jgi:ankyrin repeat protein